MNEEAKENIEFLEMLEATGRNSNIDPLISNTNTTEGKENKKIAETFDSARENESADHNILKSIDIPPTSKPYTTRPIPPPTFTHLPQIDGNS